MLGEQFKYLIKGIYTMKLEFISKILLFEIFVLFIGLIFAWDNLIKNINDLFIGGLGLLTFISIFYSLVVSGGMKIINDARKSIKDKQNKKIEEFLTKFLKEEDKLGKLDDLDKFKLEIDNIKTLIDYLNLNKWLYISVLGYLISIMCYLLPRYNWTITFQIISFWIGVTLTFVIVTSWFVANEMDLGKKD